MSSVDLLFSRIQKLEVEEERINICENDVKNTMRSKKFKIQNQIEVDEVKIEEVESNLSSTDSK